MTMMDSASAGHDYEIDAHRMLERVENLADLMDRAFEVPGLRVRFGLDALIGLVPGVGDLLANVVAMYIVYAGYRLGLPTNTVVRMFANVVIDTVIGSVPVLGDLFDMYWKANHRNVRLIREHISA